MVDWDYDLRWIMHQWSKSQKLDGWWQLLHINESTSSLASLMFRLRASSRLAVRLGACHNHSILTIHGRNPIMCTCFLFLVVRMLPSSFQNSNYCRSAPFVHRLSSPQGSAVELSFFFAERRCCGSEFRLETSITPVKAACCEGFVFKRDGERWTLEKPICMMGI